MYFLNAVILICTHKIAEIKMVALYVILNNMLCAVKKICETQEPKWKNSYGNGRDGICFGHGTSGFWVGEEVSGDVVRDRGKNACRPNQTIISHGDWRVGVKARMGK